LKKFIILIIKEKKVLFNLESFDIKLETDFVGRNFIYTDEISSTNSELLSGKENYLKSGTVLLAEHQLEGKGRKNRLWISEKNLNLTFSILLVDVTAPASQVNIINLAASLSIATSIENLYQLRTELKWPNDVLINRRKVSGILLETSVQGKKIERLVIGMGINVNQKSFPGKYNFPPTSINLESGREIERETLLAEILNNFEELLQFAISNPQHILNDWKAKCNMIGDRIKIIEKDKTIAGIFDDIDENGFLILRRGDKLEKIHFGDVSLEL
jgi:BirA family biotin operon repressor/biotin-[acetyl-CoA-carboxylase] ligase